MRVLFMKQPETICNEFLSKFENPVLVHDAAMEKKEGHKYDVPEGVETFAFPTRRNIDLSSKDALMSSKDYKVYVGMYIDKLVHFIRHNPTATIIVPILGVYGKGVKNIFDKVLRPMLWEELHMRSNVVLLWDE